MSGGPPTLASGAEGALGYQLQSSFGVPVAVPTAHQNWAEFTAKDITYDAAQKLLETGAGTRAAQRRKVRGMAKTAGGFTLPLLPTEGALLLAAFFGVEELIGGAHVLAMGLPRMLTIESQLAGQSYQYQDVFLDKLDLAQSGAEWTAKYTVMGGVGLIPIDTTEPLVPDDPTVFAWGMTTLSTAFGGISEGELGSLGLTLDNGVRQFSGAGSYAPTRGRGGLFKVSGKCSYLFDSAAAALAVQDYIDGVETDLVVTITRDSTHSLVITLPHCLVTANKPKETLPDFVSLEASFEVRAPDGVTLALLNDDSGAYLT